MPILKVDSDGIESDGTNLFSDIGQPPPPFEQQSESSQSHLVDFLDLDINSTSISNSGGDEEPPPNFSLYDADYFETSTGDTISHDPHLNTDGEALYRFLLSQANRTPSYRLHCRGTHSEQRTRWVRESNGEGRYESRSEIYTEIVTDFDFCIDIPPPLSSVPIQWSIADNEPAYRGLMVQEIEFCGVRQTVKSAEKERQDRWIEEQKVRGLPPWTSSRGDWFEGLPDDSNTFRSSKSLRQWADDYCASRKYLKEFKYEKVLYGWNLQQLEISIRSAIQATMYHGFVEVKFQTHGSKILIRPDNKLSRMLSNKWLKFLSIVLLIYPFIWLFKRFHSRGGGLWKVCGGAYALKHWVPVQAGTYGVTNGRAPHLGGLNMEPPAIPVGFRRTPNGMTRVMGLTEDEWFKKWEPKITRGVMSHYQSSTPIFDIGNENF